jgi:hypothetical protein
MINRPGDHPISDEVIRLVLEEFFAWAEKTDIKIRVTDPELDSDLSLSLSQVTYPADPFTLAETFLASIPDERRWEEMDVSKWTPQERIERLERALRITEAREVELVHALNTHVCKRCSQCQRWL